jgi:hypothetical protein
LEWLVKVLTCEKHVHVAYDLERRRRRSQTRIELTFNHSPFSGGDCQSDEEYLIMNDDQKSEGEEWGVLEDNVESNSPDIYGTTAIRATSI